MIKWFKEIGVLIKKSPGLQFTIIEITMELIKTLLGF